ncbi:MAG: YtrH family sporulation protein [Sedimentibacter sp.]|uniref:YtrH family sporulation protein n=1 Tax=Sedimentibacter sp. TaxID=1960295 RepID=UPI0031584F37
MSFYASVVQNFLVAFGVVIGAGIFSGIGAIITNNPPYKAMVEAAGSIKIWAIAASLGGTFSSFAVIEKGLFQGEVRTMIKQAIFILISLSGANVGYGFVRIIQICGGIWGK